MRQEDRVLGQSVYNSESSETGLKIVKTKSLGGS